jgi:hypothetical protein
MNRAVFRVHRQYFCSRNLSERLHHRSGSDQTFLVGKAKSSTSTQCGHGDVKPSKTHNAIDHHIGTRNKIYKIPAHLNGIKAFCHTARRAQDCSHLRTGNGIRDHHYLWAKFSHLL